MMVEEYSEFDAVGLAELIRNHDVSAIEVLEAAIARAELNNPVLNAIVYEAYDEARRAATADLPDGPFTGVPFLIKDLSCPVGGWPTTAGSRFVNGFVPPDDGVLTGRYRDSGVVLMGKTNTSEFGLTGTTESAFLGACRNPWDAELSTGGSSGGSAAAVAAGIVPIAHGNDGMGSIRIPAACCRLFGMKTTRDRNPGSSMDSERSLGMSVDHVLTRTVRDSAIMLDATGYPEPDSPFAYPMKQRPYADEIELPPGRLRILFHDDIPQVLEKENAVSDKPHPEVRAGLLRAAALLEELGHDVEEGSLGIDFRGAYQSLLAVGGSAFAAGLAQQSSDMGREPQPGELEAMTLKRLETGRRMRGADAMGGWGILRMFSRQVLRRVADYDVVLSPVLARPVPQLGYIDPVNGDPDEVERRQIECFPYPALQNVTGQPAMSVPLEQSSDGSPLGMMFAGRYGDEGTLFRLAAQLEQARPWSHRRPRIWGLSHCRNA